MEVIFGKTVSTGVGAITICSVTLALLLVRFESHPPLLVTVKVLNNHCVPAAGITGIFKVSNPRGAIVVVLVQVTVVPT